MPLPHSPLGLFGRLLLALILTASGALLLSVAWDASSSLGRGTGPHRWIDASARWVAQHVPLGRARPATGPWPASPRPGSVCLLAWASGWWLDAGASSPPGAPPGLPPFPPRRPDEAGDAGLALILLPLLHATACAGMVLAFRRFDPLVRAHARGKCGQEAPARARDTGVTPAPPPAGNSPLPRIRVLLDVMPLSALLAFFLPALVQVIWAVWWHVPRFRALMPPGHEWGVAVGPWGRAGVTLALLLAYLLVLEWSTRRVLTSFITFERARCDPLRSICLRCGYNLGGGRCAHGSTCPECGERVRADGRPVIGTGRLLAPRWRRALAPMLWALVLALLCAPFLIGRLGALMPDSVWTRLTPW